MKNKREKSHFDASIIYFKDGLFEHSLESQNATFGTVGKKE